MTSRAAMRKVIHFVRHGQAGHNVRAEPARAAGCSMDEFVRLMKEDDSFDAALTAAGVEQAERAAEALQQLQGPRGPLGVELVVASPLSRALHTADVVFPQASLPSAPPRVACEYFRERKGVLASCQRRSASALAAAWPHWDFSEVLEDDAPLSDDLETVEACAQRGYQGLCALWARPEQHLAVVAHGGLLQYLVNDHPRVRTHASLMGHFGNCEVRSCQMSLHGEGDAKDREPTFLLEPIPG
mmetsp:Transcript_113745/g.317696  ORF Transcript_113745/g.317696 Transcript_113745/m.317696 type:complete len:243 (-) Transcript_113745:65-793(-)